MNLPEMGEGGITCPICTPVCDKMQPLLAPLCVEGIRFIPPPLHAT